MFLFFFFNDTATTEIYTLSLHDALPILVGPLLRAAGVYHAEPQLVAMPDDPRSEEHTSELQSRSDLVCRLLLEKKKMRPSYYDLSPNARIHNKRLSPARAAHIPGRD